MTMAPMEVMGKGGFPEARSTLMGEVGFTRFTHRLIRVASAMRLGNCFGTGKRQDFLILY